MAVLENTTVTTNMAGTVITFQQPAAKKVPVSPNGYGYFGMKLAQIADPSFIYPSDSNRMPRHLTNTELFPVCSEVSVDRGSNTSVVLTFEDLFLGNANTVLKELLEKLNISQESARQPNDPPSIRRIRYTGAPSKLQDFLTSLAEMTEQIGSTIVGPIERPFINKAMAQALNL